MIAKAFNGDEAIQLFRELENKIDYILLDQRMPRKDGLEVLEEILRINPLAKVIFISADFSIREKVLKLGAISFFEKPINFSSILQILH